MWMYCPHVDVERTSTRMTRTTRTARRLGKLWSTFCKLCFFLAVLTNIKIISQGVNHYQCVVCLELSDLYTQQTKIFLWHPNSRIYRQQLSMAWEHTLNLCCRLYCGKRADLCKSQITHVRAALHTLEATSTKSIRSHQLVKNSNLCAKWHSWSYVHSQITRKSLHSWPAISRMHM